MIEGPKKVVIAAMMDDRLLLANADLVLGENGYDVQRRSELTSIERHIPAVRQATDIHGDATRQMLIPETVRYTKSLNVKVDAFAISTFGTVDVRTGIISNLIQRGPKAGEVIRYNLARELRMETDQIDALAIIDNDATAAALGEYVDGVGDGIPAFAYVWAGRGLNMGLILNGDVCEGFQHPEIGHTLARRHERDEAFNTCIIHDDCIRGLASYRSILERLEQRSVEEVTKIVAFYYAQLCRNIVLFSAPARIAIGGLLLQENVLPDFLSELRREFLRQTVHYSEYIENAGYDNPVGFIVESRLGVEASLLGMVEMARRRFSYERVARDQMKVQADAGSA